MSCEVAPADSRRLAMPWPELAPVALLIVVVTALYAARLGRQPIVGEESRWATGAREMLSTGDWIVPRQQGQVFPERPPMTMWAIAAAGWLRGEVDPIAVRLPSVVAVVLTSLLIFVYARVLVSQFTALTAALVYATMGQVLQIGRLGESEALFTLLVSGSLLLWHLGYLRGWSPLAAWSAGFGCAALAALVKGPQAPVYFVAVTAVYLAVQRDWRYLLGWQFAAGGVLFLSIVAAWQIPYCLATDWHSVAATWSGLAVDRFHMGGLVKHALTYPLETFACLLPWSPLLVALLKREMRAALADVRPVTTFIFTALLVTYPTVWLAAGAVERYFMPLYPLIAVLIGLVIERCATAAGGYPRRAWRQFLTLCGAMIAVGGVVVGASEVIQAVAGASADWLYQPRWFSLTFALVAGGAIYVIGRCHHSQGRFAPISAVIAIAVFVGTAYTGVAININVARWNDPADAVARMKSLLPADARLVSLSPIEHRFAYYYQTPIPEIDWPVDVAEVPQDVEYFCFMRHPGDTAERRASGRGRSWTTTAGTLPFAWEEVASICVARRLRDTPQPTVVLGRVVRPLQAAISDATTPRQASRSRLPSGTSTSL